MKEYYILGSGGFAKEVYFFAESVLQGTSTFKGFIDLQPGQKHLKVRGREEAILDEATFLKNIKPSEDTHLYMGIGDPKLLLKLSRRFEKYTFPNLFTKNFIWDQQSISLGRGNIFTAGCILTTDIEIGSFNVFNLASTIGHDVIIKDCNIYNPGTNISGNVTIDSGNLFGTNSTVLQNIKIGSGNVVGASSLVNREIGDNNVLVGVPAKKIKNNE